MRKFNLMAMGLFIMVMAACAHGLSAPSKTDEWLSTKKAPPAINISGFWDGGNSFTGGWGEANFIQKGKDVTGGLGIYDVKGVVSVRDIYMVLSSGGEFRYTARLSSQKDGSLRGKAWAGAIIDDPDSKNAVEYPIVLKKIRK